MRIFPCTNVSHSRACERMAVVRHEPASVAQSWRKEKPIERCDKRDSPHFMLCVIVRLQRGVFSLVLPPHGESLRSKRQERAKRASESLSGKGEGAGAASETELSPLPNVIHTRENERWMWHDMSMRMSCQVGAREKASESERGRQRKRGRAQRFALPERNEGTANRAPDRRDLTGLAAAWRELA